MRFELMLLKFYWYFQEEAIAFFTGTLSQLVFPAEWLLEAITGCVCLQKHFPLLLLLASSLVQKKRNQNKWFALKKKCHALFDLALRGLCLLMLTRARFDQCASVCDLLGSALFCVVTVCVCVCRPNVVSWDKVLRMTSVERLDHAFSVAKEQLAIERLLDPEGMNTPKHKGCCFFNLCVCVCVCACVCFCLCVCVCMLFFSSSVHMDSSQTYIILCLCLASLQTCARCLS